MVVGFLLVVLLDVRLLLRKLSTIGLLMVDDRVRVPMRQQWARRVLAWT